MRVSKTLIKTIRTTNPFHNKVKADKAFTLSSFLHYFQSENICVKDRISQQEMAQGTNNRGHQEASEELGVICSIYLN